MVLVVAAPALPLPHFCPSICITQRNISLDWPVHSLWISVWMGLWIRGRGACELSSAARVLLPLAKGNFRPLSHAQDLK